MTPQNFRLKLEILATHIWHLTKQSAHEALKKLIYKFRGVIFLLSDIVGPV